MTATHLDVGRAVFETEIEAARVVMSQLDESFSRTIDLILDTEGRVIVCGMGKSGIIARKIAATLASTGTPSLFLHPAEAYHGDLGMVTSKDLILALSNSGETEEVIRLIPFLQDHGIPLVTVTGDAESTLAKHSTVHLLARPHEEACPLKLAPTSSTTVALVLGDAIAVATMKARQFQPEDFARFHPGGSLGRRLLTRVRDVMKQSVPTCLRDDDIRTVVTAISEGRAGACLVVGDGQTLGVITDGDLRRALQSERFPELTAAQVMTRSPLRVPQDSMLHEAREIMSKHKITFLLAHAEDRDEITGFLNIHDLDGI